MLLSVFLIETFVDLIIAKITLTSDKSNNNHNDILRSDQNKLEVPT